MAWTRRTLMVITAALAVAGAMLATEHDPASVRASTAACRASDVPGRRVRGLGGAIPGSSSVVPVVAPELSWPDVRADGVDGAGARFPAADPALVRDGDRWRIFTTQEWLVNVPTWTSIDGVAWTGGDDAMPQLPGWATFGLTWSPDVVGVGERWVLFYSALYGETGVHCIGHAVSARAAGPFKAHPEPIVCELDEGGSIDPSVFVDEDGSLFLLWKVDANHIGETSVLRAQSLSDGGTSLVGEAIDLLRLEAAWERPLIEQPEMVRVDGQLHLLDAAGWFNQPTYQVGHATCETPLGPCTRTSTDGGWLVADDRFLGPGAVSLETLGDDLVGVYHAWVDGIEHGTSRTLVVDRIEFVDGAPRSRR